VSYLYATTKAFVLSRSVIRVYDPPHPRFKKACRYNIPGHAHFLTFSCQHRLPLLTNDVWRLWLAESVTKACTRHEMALWAYVFMPEHVHLLVRPDREVYRIGDFLRSVKQPVATRVLTSLKKKSAPVLNDLVVSPTGRSKGHRFWQAGGGHDLNIWTFEKAMEKAQYCHRNPVQRGIVSDPAEWRWSSYRWLEEGCSDDSPLKLDPWREYSLGDNIGR
jgi:putative transposase